ncbi:unnamed protein product [Bursaphelenchus xylophilus]|uniref:(pine wood nematode) hypothetical protein n=1 Tax=Bursaphelenchus xylophilus TaxID=6326 RepID=A0A7I8XCL0_BURXY|nr:unnamed protein product [Bursaphelenchus xylophilus]CAG9131683.1 unnamed protein product [Bursaphelenchus xylophilus]
MNDIYELKPPFYVFVAILYPRAQAPRKNSENFKVPNTSNRSPARAASTSYWSKFRSSQTNPISRLAVCSAAVNSPKASTACASKSMAQTSAICEKDNQVRDLPSVIKESAFYVKKDRDTYRFVITDLGYAIRIGSERSAFYPIPETATTHIHAKKALKSEDTESLLFMILGMMAPLPWAGIKNIEEVRKIKLECTEEDSIPDEFNTKDAVTLCHMRGLYTDDLALENVAEMLILYYLAVEPTDDLHLPVRFPNAEFKLAGTFKSYD